jgi:hypothetical protein
VTELVKGFAVASQTLSRLGEVILQISLLAHQSKPLL